MLASGTISRAVLLVLAICLIGSGPSYPQGASSFNSSKTTGNRLSSGAWLAKCAPLSTYTLAGGRFSDGGEWPPIANGIMPDSNVANAPDALCVEPAFSPAPRTAADNPCPEVAGGIPGVPSPFPCNSSADTVQAELAVMGKPGLKIARAREGVLQILRTRNACSEWLETKDANPAATFQSLDFLIDHHGPQDIFESMTDESITIWRQPYVASATQDGGAHTTITLNAYGAFYRTQGQVQKTVAEGGPLRGDGSRMLTVGFYRGDTLPAQMVTLLHEFGHIIDLLPEDADNLDGKSVRNTDEVLRHCRAEVEARAHQSKQAAKR
jgi:hypothetical protein